MKTTQEMIAVMQAYVEGKVIEVKAEDGWKLAAPAWNWGLREYRIKPEPPQPKIVPYESAKEFLAAMKEHGPFLKNPHAEESVFVSPFIVKNDMCFYPMFDKEEYTYGAFEFYHALLYGWQWQDGTPCGKEVTE